MAFAPPPPRLARFVVEGLSTSQRNPRYDASERQLASVRARIRTIEESGRLLVASQNDVVAARLMPEVAMTPPPITRNNWWSVYIGEYAAQQWIDRVNEQARVDIDAHPNAALYWGRLIKNDNTPLSTAIGLERAFELLSELLDRLTDTNDEKTRYWRIITRRYLYENSGNPLVRMARGANIRQTLARFNALFGDKHNPALVAANVEAADPLDPTGVRKINAQAVIRDFKALMALYDDEKKYTSADDVLAALFVPSGAYPRARNPNVAMWHMDAIAYNRDMYMAALELFIDVQMQTALRLRDTELALLRDFVRGPYLVRDDIVEVYLTHRDNMIAEALLDLIVAKNDRPLYLQLIDGFLTEDVANAMRGVPAEQYAAQFVELPNRIATDETKRLARSIETGASQPHITNDLLAIFLVTLDVYSRMADAPSDTARWVDYSLYRRDRAPKYTHAALHPELYVSKQQVTDQVDAWFDENTRNAADDWFYKWGDSFLIRTNRPPLYYLKRELLEMLKARDELESTIEVDKEVRLRPDEPIDETIAIETTDPAAAQQQGPWSIVWYFKNARTSHTRALARFRDSTRLYLHEHSSGDYDCTVNGVRSAHTLRVISLRFCVRCGNYLPDTAFDANYACTWTPADPIEVYMIRERAERADTLIARRLPTEWFRDDVFGYAALINTWSTLFLLLSERQRRDITHNREVIENGVSLDMPFGEAWALVSNKALLRVFELDPAVRVFIEKIDNAARKADSAFADLTVEQIISRVPELARVFCDEQSMHRAIADRNILNRTMEKTRWIGSHSTVDAQPMPQLDPFSAVRGDTPADTEWPFKELADVFSNPFSDYTDAERADMVRVYNEYAAVAKTSTSPRIVKQPLKTMLARAPGIGLSVKRLSLT